jgi:hypothetical protein
MNLTTITSSDDHQFFPTPPEVAKRMLAGIDWNKVETILEPSAGKGNLIEAIGEEVFNEQMWENYRFRRDHKVDVDCVEIDPYLRSILKYQFSEERRRLVYDEMCEELKRKNGKENDSCFRAYEGDYTPLYHTLDKTDVRIVHNDFLTYKPYKRYDIIVMNPPFKDGDKHLLHAIDIQRHGGSILCLLNSETLNNPYSNTRKELKKRLDQYGATVEYITNGFKDAERSADVDVAIVKVTIPTEEIHSEIFERLEKAAEAENFTGGVTDLVVTDFIEAAVCHFNVECRAGIELIREWQAMRPLIMDEIKSNSLNNPILELKLHGTSDYHYLDINEYLRMVRLKYWRGLFTNEDFMRKMTTKLREQYLSTVEKMKDYDFSVFNIQSVLVEMNAQVITGVQDEILKIFDKLTAEHSYYPECKQNIHYYSGWCTNQAHKIGKKSIIPEYLQAYSWSSDAFDVYKAYGVLSDIEKIFDYLSGNMSREPMKTDLHSALKLAKERHQSQNINCTYFTVTIYKKGTVHIKYTYPELVDRLNIYAARNRNWLPPCYGKKRYADMTADEQAVVNDFHRDEKEKEVNPKKSAERYAAVLAASQFYIAEPVRSVGLLGIGVAE